MELVPALSLGRSVASLRLLNHVCALRTTLCLSFGLWPMLAPLPPPNFSLTWFGSLLL